MEKRKLPAESGIWSMKTGCGFTAVLRRTRQGDMDELLIEVPYAGAYGMGEKFNGLNQKGKSCVNEVEEKFCRQGEKTYLPMPFFLTDTGLGVYLETARTTWFSFGDAIQCGLPPEAEVHLFAGKPGEIIASFMKLSGPALLPPPYAFGVWISANRWNCQADVERTLALLEEHRFPASVLVLEAWSDEATFYIWNGAAYGELDPERPVEQGMFDFSASPQWPDPQGMIRRIHEKGLRLVLWQIPVWKEQDAGEKPNRQLDADKVYAIEKGICVKRENGAPYRIPEGNWFAGSLIPDFTNPRTREFWFSRRRYLLEMGVDGFKTDGGEFICRTDVRLANGMDGTEAKNSYARQYQEAYTEFLSEAQGTAADGRSGSPGNGRVLFSRAGFCGAHTTPMHWGGDQQSENGELKSVLAAGLSASMSGILFWGFDLAGFAGPMPTPDLYRRATQLACFVPVMQWHSEPDGGQFREKMPGMEGNNERSPWNVARCWGIPELIGEIRFWHELRVKLIPYLYATAVQCVQEYAPMMRPLVYDWPQSPEAVETEDEFMLGEDLLVAPLLEENQTCRRVWLPEGGWYPLFSRERRESGWIVSEETERFPVYVRAEAVSGCPDGDRAQSAGEIPRGQRESTARNALRKLYSDLNGTE